jgi:hypothetical protein
VEAAVSAAAVDHVVAVDSAAAVVEAEVAVAAVAAAAVEAGGRHENIQNINPRICKGDEDDASTREH